MDPLIVAMAVTALAASTVSTAALAATGRGPIGAAPRPEHRSKAPSPEGGWSPIRGIPRSEGEPTEAAEGRTDR